MGIKVEKGLSTNECDVNSFHKVSTKSTEVCGCTITICKSVQGVATFARNGPLTQTISEPVRPHTTFKNLGYIFAF